MPPAQSRKLSAHQFAWLRLFLVIRRFSPTHIEAAQLCMVEGLSMEIVAGRLHLNSRQAVGNTVRRVWALWLQVAGQYLPPDHQATPAVPAVEASPVSAGRSTTCHTSAEDSTSAPSDKAVSPRVAKSRKSSQKKIGLKQQ